ncbi:unnamed protein product [Moneuplotes crassus]|uniref:Uncharacterized protein n=1 Tax=Euplotes crassus TaxID=5936 RepID=A0AAD1Y4D2_EUPCR|nr:unnamed protein product [Moneuplotes crassus]
MEMIFRLLLASFCFISALSLAKKMSIVEAISDIDELIYANFTLKIPETIKNTYRASILPAYLHVFIGKVENNDTFIEEPIPVSISKAVESMKKFQRGQNYYSYALKDFLHKMSLLVEEIESPYPDSDSYVNLKEYLSHDHNSVLDEKIFNGDYLNYAGMMALNDGYFCSLDEEEDANLIEISQKFFEFLSTMSSDRISEKDIETLNFVSYEECNNTLEFLDVADQIRNYKVTHEKEIMKLAQQIIKEVDQDTPTDLSPKDLFDLDYYAQLSKAKEFMEEAIIKIGEELIETKNVKENSKTEEFKDKVKEFKHINTTDEFHKNKTSQVNTTEHVDDHKVPESEEKEQRLGIPLGQGGLGNQPQVAQQNQVQNEVFDDGIDEVVDNLLNDIQPGIGGRIGNFFYGIAMSSIAAMTEFWNNRILPASLKKEKMFDNEDHPFIKRIKEHAFSNTSESDEYLLILGNIYAEGNAQYGIVEDIDKAAEYYEMSANLGNMEAVVYIGTYYLNRDKLKSFKYLNKCVNENIIMCHFSIGSLYADPLYEKSDTEKAIHHLTISLKDPDLKHLSAQALKILYRHGENTFEKEKMPEDFLAKSEEYFEIEYFSSDFKMFRDSDRNYFVNRILDEIDFENQQEIARLTDKFIEYVKFTEIDRDTTRWYNLGYVKYSMGEFDRALLSFAFGAAIDHTDSMMAAGYIWTENLTNLTCRFGNNLICGAYYYLRAGLNGDRNGVNHFIKILYTLAAEKPENEKKILLEICYKSYNLISGFSAHTMYNQAWMSFFGEGTEQNSTLAYENLDILLTKTWEKAPKNILPVVLAMVYFEVYETLPGGMRRFIKF